MLLRLLLDEPNRHEPVALDTEISTLSITKES
jgi:hypothetical protein